MINKHQILEEVRVWFNERYARSTRDIDTFYVGQHIVGAITESEIGIVEWEKNADKLVRSLGADEYVVRAPLTKSILNCYYRYYLLRSAIENHRVTCTGVAPFSDSHQACLRD